MANIFNLRYMDHLQSLHSHISIQWSTHVTFLKFPLSAGEGFRTFDFLDKCLSECMYSHSYLAAEGRVTSWHSFLVHFMWFYFADAVFYNYLKVLYAFVIHFPQTQCFQQTTIKFQLQLLFHLCAFYYPCILLIVLSNF